MITITKGSKTLNIPAGAYTSYASAGWERLTDATRQTKPKTRENHKVTKEKPVEKPAEVSEDDKEDTVYVNPEELLEKPLEELDYEELKIVADYLGIDTKGMKTSKSLRSAVRKSM